MNAKTIFSTVRYAFAATLLGLSVYAAADTVAAGRAEPGCGDAANPCVLEALTVTATAGQRLAGAGLEDEPSMVETARLAPKAPPALPAES